MFLFTSHSLSHKFLLLLAPPIFTKKPRTVHAYQHTDVRFECLADGMPKPRIIWSKTGDIITNTPFTTVGKGFLLILEVALSDMGSYQCFAENDLGRIQATAELYVYRKGKYYLQSWLNCKLIIMCSCDYLLYIFLPFHLQRNTT